MPAIKPMTGPLKQLADLRLDAIPSHRVDRGSTPFGDQRHHPSTCEVTPQPTAWSREVGSPTDKLGSTDGAALTVALDAHYDVLGPYPWR